MGASVSTAATVLVAVGADVGLRMALPSWGCLDVGAALPRVVSMTSVGSGKGGATLRSVAGTTASCDTSLRCFSVLPLPQL